MKLAKELEVGDLVWTPDGWLPIDRLHWYPAPSPKRDYDEAFVTFTAGRFSNSRYRNEPVPTAAIPA